MKNPILFISALVLLFSACKPTAQIRVLQPADINLPAHVTTVAIVDRSKPSSGWANFGEGLFSGETVGQDKRCREQAAQALITQLTKTPRLTVKNTGIELEGSRNGSKMAEPMEWQKIEDICAEQGANLVLVIESLDSDVQHDPRKSENKKKDDKGKEFIETVFENSLEIGVKIGWRLYDPKQKVLLDEHTSESRSSKRRSHGKTAAEALRNLPDQSNMARDMAKAAGEKYGQRIAPTYVSLQRTYFKKAKGGFEDQMAQGQRFADSNQWDKAAGIWESVVKNAGGNQDAAGKAAYNIALSHEVRGDLEKAMEWAQKSYTDFGNKSAKEYVGTIRQRQNDVRKTAIQMNGKKV